MASTFTAWLRSPAARDYFFSELYHRHIYILIAILIIFPGTHFWGPVSFFQARIAQTLSQLTLALRLPTGDFLSLLLPTWQKMKKSSQEP